MLRKPLKIVALAATAAAQKMCTGEFERITSVEFVKNLNPGWNPGNSLDAIPTETSWGQPLLVNSTFTNVKRRGFNGVRIPSTLPTL
jgi:endoglucanase